MAWRMHFAWERNGSGPFTREIPGLYKTPRERESTSFLIPKPKACARGENVRTLGIFLEALSSTLGRYSRSSGTESHIFNLYIVHFQTGQGRTYPNAILRTSAWRAKSNLWQRHRMALVSSSFERVSPA